MAAPTRHQVLQRKRVYDGFAKVDRVKLQHEKFDGQLSGEIEREYIQRRPAAGALLYDEVHQLFALIEQFRVGAMEDPGGSPWQLEVVAGLVDTGETPESTVIRESQEEAGVKVNKLTLLHEFLTSAGASNERYTLFLAEADLSGAGGIHGLPEEGEDIRVHVYPVQQLPALLESGKLRNASVLVAIQALYLRLLKEGRLALPSSR